MALIRAKHTKPEVLVRKMISSLGYRYRLHRRDLPGVPDLVFPRAHRALFVHGCFWHQHPGCRHARMPKSRLGYWKPKLEGNRQRDLRNQARLRRAGWKVSIFWECQLRKPDVLARRLDRFLRST